MRVSVLFINPGTPYQRVRSGIGASILSDRPIWICRIDEPGATRTKRLAGITSPWAQFTRYEKAGCMYLLVRVRVRSRIPSTIIGNKVFITTPIIIQSQIKLPGSLIYSCKRVGNSRFLKRSECTLMQRLMATNMRFRLMRESAA